MGTTNTPRDLISPLLGPVQTTAERTARAEAEAQLVKRFEIALKAKLARVALAVSVQQAINDRIARRGAK